MNDTRGQGTPSDPLQSEAIRGEAKSAGEELLEGSIGVLGVLKQSRK